jgi:hypothetical protein
MVGGGTRSSGVGAPIGLVCVGWVSASGQGGYGVVGVNAVVGFVCLRGRGG